MHGTATMQRDNTIGTALNLLEKVRDQHGDQDAVNAFWVRKPSTLQGRPPRAQYKTTRQLISMGNINADRMDSGIRRLREALTT